MTTSLRRLHLLLEHVGSTRALRLAFVAATYLFAASYGHRRLPGRRAQPLPLLRRLRRDRGHPARAQAAGPAIATTAKDRLLVLADAALVAAAIVAGPRPLILYYASAYTVGLLATALLT